MSLIDTSFVSPNLQPLKANKNGFNFIIFHFDIRGKLFIIRCVNNYYSILNATYILLYNAGYYIGISTFTLISIPARMVILLTRMSDKFMYISYDDTQNCVKLVIETLDTHLNKQTNKSSIKVSKLVKQMHKQTLL